MLDGGVIERIEKLIRDAIQVDQIDVDTDLISDGVMDSLALVALITEIEADFGIELPLDDFDIEMFRSVRTIAGFVAGSLPVEEKQ